jgi:hypothetical protein
MKYQTIKDLILAMKNGDVSTKNPIFIDNDVIYCSLIYDRDGNEIDYEDEEIEDIFSFEGHPQMLLIEVLQMLTKAPIEMV